MNNINPVYPVEYKEFDGIKVMVSMRDRFGELMEDKLHFYAIHNGKWQSIYLLREMLEDSEFTDVMIKDRLIKRLIN